MNTKEAIKFIDDMYEWAPPDCEDKAEKYIPEVIELLQRGEKYEAIVDELENFIPKEDMKVPEEYLGVVGGVTRYIAIVTKQKYFPKPIKNERR